MTPEERRALVGEVVGGSASAPAPVQAPQGGEVVPGESLARGAFQGLSSGWGDEAAGALAAALPFTDPEAAKGETFSERRKNATDFYRGRNAAAETSDPSGYLGGQIVGGVLGAGKVGTGVGAVLKSAGMGMAAGSGYSEADEAIGLLRDTALGGALGLGGHALGAGVGKVFDWVRGKGAALAGAARGKIAQEAAEVATARVKSVEGSLGNRAANAYNQMDRIERQLANPATPSAIRAELEAFKLTPEYAALVEANAKSILSAAPDAAAELAAAREIATEARAALPAEIARETAARAIPQKAADVRSFVKMYGEPIAWAYGANKAAEALGADNETQMGAAGVAGLLGGRTRAGKALMTRVNRPAHQLQFAEALQKAAEAGSPLAKRLLALSGPAAGVSMLTREEAGP